MFLGIPASLFTVGADAVDISVSVCSFSLETSSVILRNSSHSDNASILFVLLELVLFILHVFHSQQVTLPSIICIHLSCKVSSSMLYQMLRP